MGAPYGTARTPLVAVPSVLFDSLGLAALKQAYLLGYKTYLLGYRHTFLDPLPVILTLTLGAAGNLLPGMLDPLRLRAAVIAPLGTAGGHGWWAGPPRMCCTSEMYLVSRCSPARPGDGAAARLRKPPCNSRLLTPRVPGSLSLPVTFDSDSLDARLPGPPCHPPGASLLNTRPDCSGARSLHDGARQHDCSLHSWPRNTKNPSCLYPWCTSTCDFDYCYYTYADANFTPGRAIVGEFAPGRAIADEFAVAASQPPRHVNDQFMNAHLVAASSK
eukprot:361197-Chlamydomonas_euryale.AAC.3